MQSERGRRVVIDARVTPRLWGGVAHATKSLIEALGRLSDGDEQYALVIAADDQRGYIGTAGPNQTFIDEREALARRLDAERRSLSTARRLRESIKRALRARMRQFLEGSGEPARAAVEVSWGLFEGTGADVVHFPTQRYALCSLPSIYNPHDLQHLHYPRFFSAEEIARREVVYGAGCRHAHTIVVGSAWTKNDVVTQYGIAAPRVQVIPEGARTPLAGPAANNAIAAANAAHGLSGPFLFYPAVTWPHKNHLRLLEALRRIRDESGMKVQLVCTGERYESFQPELDRAVRELGLGDQVRFLGFVSEETLGALYHTAHGLIIPSLFEGSSLPVYEAWHAGIPVASSSATALPEQVLDAGVVFDPEDVGAMARAVRVLMSDDAERRRIVARGTQRLGDFDWDRTARAYRAVYRRAAGWRLNDEDRWLLSWNWMKDPGARPPDAGSG